MGNPDIVVCPMGFWTMTSSSTPCSQKASAMGGFAACKNRRAANFLMVEDEIVVREVCDKNEVLYEKLGGGGGGGASLWHRNVNVGTRLRSLSTRVFSISFCRCCTVNRTKSRVVCWICMCVDPIRIRGEGTCYVDRTGGGGAAKGHFLTCWAQTP